MSNLKPQFNKPRHVGLLAGAGRFPIAFAEAARAQGHKVSGLGIANLFDEKLASVCHEFDTVPLGKLGKAIRHFRRSDAEHVVMAGKIHKTVLFHPFRLFRLLPDWRALHMWFRYARENRADDTLLLAVIREFARDNVHFASALDYCPELLVDHGFLTRRKPSSSQWDDIHFGWDMAKAMGKLDVGQTVCINDSAVIAVEAIEGTDECIRRAGQLCRRGGFTVVKVAKPQQDMRFDVPTIGIETIQTMHEAGARVLAVESDMTILLDQTEVTALADKFGITIVAMNADELKLKLAS
jgi:DUF1009 family protein